MLFCTQLYIESGASDDELPDQTDNNLDRVQISGWRVKSDSDEEMTTWLLN